MPFTRKVKFTLTDHVDTASIAHSNLFESEYSRVGLKPEEIDVYTKLLLHCNGTDGSPTFIDETGKTVTAYDNAQIDTAQSKFGGASGLFDGTGDYLSIPDSVDFDFGTGDFTIDLWFRTSTLGITNVLMSHGTSTSNYWVLYISTDNKLNWYYNGSIAISTGALASNTWYHLTAVRSGTTTKLYINGVNDGSGTDANNYAMTGDLRIARDWGATPTYGNGWKDEIRISKGIARWTANFTPPPSAYGAYPTNSPSPATVWTALKSVDVVDMSTAKVWMYKDGIVQAAGNTDIMFKYAANNGSDSTAKTLTQLRAETDVTVTNETNSFKIYGLYASDGAYKSESETWIEFNVISADGGGFFSTLID